MTRRVIFLPGVRWHAPDGHNSRDGVHSGGWFVIEGRGCVYEIVAGPFATLDEAERARPPR